MKKLSTKPYKGARDFYPEDMRIRNYIFEIWRETALNFGYEEYDFPLLERYEIYAEKSGEDLVNNQLYSFEDKGGRRLAIRPEKTPSLARMVASKVNSLPRPIRWFNIGNCWRYEKPQKGRGREFYQFDCDIFGAEKVTADAEVFSIPIEAMKKFGATKDMFEIRINNRRFAEYYLKEIIGLSGEINKKGSQIYKVVKAIDTKLKITREDFVKLLEEANLSSEQIQKTERYLGTDIKFVEKYVEKNEGAQELVDFFTLMGQANYSEYIKYSPETIRGLDYYTGTVIEQFDLNPKNNRSMYGGGRYDDLMQLFSDTELNGVGFAMGDMTLLEFLRDWNLVPELNQEVDYLVTLWSGNTGNGGKDSNKNNNEYIINTFKTARKLREKGNNVITWLEPGTSISQQLSFARKKRVKNVIIQGDKEIGRGIVSVKNMATGEQKEVGLEEL